jgi:hypothetical protein
MELVHRTVDQVQSIYSWARSKFIKPESVWAITLQICGSYEKGEGVFLGSNPAHSSRIGRPSVALANSGNGAR